MTFGFCFDKKCLWSLPHADLKDQNRLALCLCLILISRLIFPNFPQLFVQNHTSETRRVNVVYAELNTVSIILSLV